MLGDLINYKEEWNKNKSVTIKNLFPTEIANQIRNDYVSHPDFKTSFYTGKTAEDGSVPILYANKNTPEYTELTKKVKVMNSNGNFTYRFSRTDWIHPKLHELWSSPIFSNALCYITGNEELTWQEYSTFTSKYESGDFLNTHTDLNHGKVAFVYQLTENWLPQYGGLFMRLNKDSDQKIIDKTVLPTFNELTIFDVTGEGVPHLVTQVVEGLNDARIGYSGWLK